MKTTLMALLLLTAACQTNQQTTATAEQTDTTGQAAATETSEAPAQQCYAYVSAADTVRLTLRRAGATVTGDLVYQLSGKDRNTGTLAGQLRGDTLLAEYTFQSEGTTSVREVAFLQKDGGFVEGYAPVTEQNGKMVFQNRGALAFTATRPLKPTDCR